MPLIAVSLILVSSFLHAFWNLLLKSSEDKLSFTILSLLVAMTAYSPMFVFEARYHVVPLAGWACILATGVAYLGYFVGLADAYDGGDLSLVYPIARGAGPAFSFIGGILLLAERPTLAGAIGAGLIIFGIAALSIERDDFSVEKLKDRTIPALKVGATVGIYSLIDKIGVGKLHINPPLYIYLTYFTSGFSLAVWFLYKFGKERLKKEWAINGGRCLTVGVFNLATYLMILYAMSLPRTPVSYVAPLRSVSVLFGVLFGSFLLGESGLSRKLKGAAIMILGILLIALKG